MRTVLTAAAAAALIASLASPAVAAPHPEAGSAPSSNAAGTAAAEATAGIKTNESNGSFDLQSHRGGRGEWTEESLAAFANSLKLGVTTLELDTHLTADGKVIVWHDDTIQADKCQDTAPAAPGDAAFPYVGDRVAELSLAQIKTLDCGFTQLKGYPEQDVIEGNRIAELKDVFQLVRDAGAKKVRFNVETKVEDGKSGGEGMVALTTAVVAEISGVRHGGPHHRAVVRLVIAEPDQGDRPASCRSWPCPAATPGSRSASPAPAPTSAASTSTPTADPSPRPRPPRATTPSPPPSAPSPPG